MTYEQLHFAVGASIPFVISLFFYKKKFIFLTPLIMTLTGIIAFLPHYLGLEGSQTNLFFFYGIIHSTFSKGQFIGYALIIIMFTIIIGLQSLYLWRNKYA